MSDLKFPDLPGITWQVSWQPSFNTKIQTAVSGKEYRASLMANPIYKLTLNYEFLRHGAKNELRQLVGLFLQTRGAFDNFLYKFPDDSAVTDQLIGVGDGKTKIFQLSRSFGSAFSEPVQNVDVVTNIKVAGVVKTGGYTVSESGLVTFAAAPTGDVSWSGSYFYRVRFEQDSQEVEQFMKDLWSAKKVQLIGSLGRRI
ncbi:DUF2460 domain-containing protein [Undibacterium sp. Di26W]|uniref:DUF2460 domain-containing protein n=1 Tax=Undibacterium sp. Di26W TaxID=3413035 RepID=UPI003BF0064A